MTYGYARQVAGVALAISVIGLTSVWIAARNFDRNTRAIEDRGRADRRP
ncbi:hypothetical protein [Methylobacterium sp. Leaf466]|nr:hypothetical protein [Methylobacterium sp. Leaf466]